jgi:hypothetical protein
VCVAKTRVRVTYSFGPACISLPHFTQAGSHVLTGPTLYEVLLCDVCLHDYVSGGKQTHAGWPISQALRLAYPNPAQSYLRRVPGHEGQGVAVQALLSPDHLSEPPSPVLVFGMYVRVRNNRLVGLPTIVTDVVPNPAIRTAPCVLSFAPGMPRARFRSVKLPLGGRAPCALRFSVRVCVGMCCWGRGFTPPQQSAHGFCYPCLDNTDSCGIACGIAIARSKPELVRTALSRAERLAFTGHNSLVPRCAGLCSTSFVSSHAHAMLGFSLGAA